MNQTSYEVTCMCEHGYKFNKEKEQCENCEF